MGKNLEYSKGNDYGNRKNVFKTLSFTVIIATFLINVFSLSLPILTLQVYDRILLFQNMGTFIILILGVVIAISLDCFLRIIRNSLISWSSAIQEHVLSCRAVTCFLYGDRVEINKQNIGDYVQRMHSISKIKDFSSGQLLILFIDIPFIIVFLLLISWLGGFLVFIHLFLLAIFGIISMCLASKLKSILQKRGQNEDNKIDFLIRILSSIHSVKAMGREKKILGKYSEIQEVSTFLNYDAAVLSMLASNVSVFIGQVMIVCVIAFGALMVIEGSITMGVMVACILLSGRIMQPLHKMLSVWVRYQEYEVAKMKFDDLLTLKQKEFGSDSIARKKPDLLMENVYFGYSHGSDVIEGLDLFIPFGTIVSVGGEEGCGKSTLLKLITGELVPYKGRVTYSDVDVHKIRSDERAAHIGYLSPESTIFHGSILDNITCFRDELKGEALEIASILGIDAEIARLPKGYATELMDVAADPIPPGLKQRISIARVLVLKPKIIIYDNADRSLDRDGYNYIYRLLGRLKKKATVIVLSDDMNIMRMADVEYRILNGKINICESQGSKKFSPKLDREL